MFSIVKLFVICEVVFWLVIFGGLINLGVVLVFVLVWFEFWIFGFKFLIVLVIGVRVVIFVFDFLEFRDVWLEFDVDLLVGVLSWGVFKLKIDFLEIILGLLIVLDRGVEIMVLESRLNLLFFLVVV